MAELCNLSDLPPSQCGCRIHKPEADRLSQLAPRRSVEAGPAFAARFGGKCDACGDGFPAGAAIRAWDGAFVHDGCEEAA